MAIVSHMQNSKNDLPAVIFNIVANSTTSNEAILASLMMTTGFYKSIPPISRAYGTACLLVTIACQLGLYHPVDIALLYELVFSNFQVWRLITNFFFLGKFSINFGIRLLMIARYGVQLENGPFQRRTADFLWMMIFGALTLLALSAIPFFRSPFLGISLVFMLLYVWSREFPSANINIYGIVTLKAFYFPWAMLGLDMIFGSPIMPDLLGIIAGHLYYFLTVLHPLATGKNLLKTPIWVHKLVMRWRIGAPSGTPAQPDNPGAAFRGRSYRVGGATAYPPQPDRGSGVAATNSVQPDNGSGVAFRGRSYRLGG